MNNLSKAELAQIAPEMRRVIETMFPTPKKQRSELTAEDLRQKYYRSKKQPISLRVDADVMAWLKHGGKGWQTRANQALREAMLRELEPAGPSAGGNKSKR